jgi:hypothetical protein
MVEPVSLLLLEFLTWVAARPRTYADSMEAWRSACPRQTVWEDALLSGLVLLEGAGQLHQSAVTLTARGRAVLRSAQRPPSDGKALSSGTSSDPVVPG